VVVPPLDYSIVVFSWMGGFGLCRWCWAVARYTSAAKVPRLSPSSRRQLAICSLLWSLKGRCPNRLYSILVRAWRFCCSAGSRSRSTCNAFPSNARARWLAVSSSLQPLCKATSWT